MRKVQLFIHAKKPLGTKYCRSDIPPLTHPTTLPKIEYMSSLADIIAQETQDGRLIIRFLVSAMEDDLPEFQPCHRIDAARLLVELGFDQAQAAIDRARADQRERTPNRDSCSQPQPKTRWLFESASEAETESQSATNSIRSRLAQIVREETDDGRVAVRFLIDAMHGQFPDFKPCHRLSAAKELLQRGFDNVPDDPDAQAEAEPEPEPTPEELAAKRRAELMEFSNHGPVYYQTRPFPCVCEDRLHDCKGNLLDEQQLAQVARRPPAMEYLLRDPDQMGRFPARYAEYLTHWNAEHPRNPIDINRFVWTNPTWRHFNNTNPVRGP